MVRVLTCRWEDAGELALSISPYLYPPTDKYHLPGWSRMSSRVRMKFKVATINNAITCIAATDVVVYTCTAHSTGLWTYVNSSQGPYRRNHTVGNEKRDKWVCYEWVTIQMRPLQIGRRYDQSERQKPKQITKPNGTNSGTKNFEHIPPTYKVSPYLRSFRHEMCLQILSNFLLLLILNRVANPPSIINNSLWHNMCCMWVHTSLSNG